MPIEFASWFGFYKFSHSVQNLSRYFRDSDDSAFLDTLLQTSSKRHFLLPEGKLLWRAQIGFEPPKTRWEQPTPHLPKRMKPLPNSAHEGRVNPKGIPCLYLCTDKKTAMAEIRPAVGSLVSTGQFRILRNLTLIDFSVEHESQQEVYSDEPAPAERERSVWAQVDRAFSEPVVTDPGTSDYVPTQVISEFFRNQGFDGVVYKSRLDKGYNIAVFDLAAAQLVDCALFRVRSVSFDFEEPTNAFHVIDPKSE